MAGESLQPQGWGPEHERSDIHGLLWLYGLVFFSQFKPTEPFLVDFLVEDKGFSNHEVYQEIFPLFVYSRFPLLIVTGLASELPSVGGTGVLAFGAVCGLITVLLTWCGLGHLPQQIAQITVSASFASRFAVNAVVFQLASSRTVQQHVHMMKAVLLLSNSGSAILGEVLRDAHALSLSAMYAISAAATAAAVVCALWLLLREAPQSARAPVGRCDGGLRASFSDLFCCLSLPCVAWWTIWALIENPAHGLALTYWQNLLKASGIKEAHNGYILGATYLAAAALVVACCRSRLLRHFSELLPALSLAAAGALLICLATSHVELTFYCCLLPFQCVFEVTTAVSTFQVGSDISNAVARSARDGTAPKQARLALLFSITGVLAGVAETVVQAVLNRLHPISLRFVWLGLELILAAVVMAAVAAVCRAIARHRSHQVPAAQDPFLMPSQQLAADPRRDRRTVRGTEALGHPPSTS